MNNVPKWPDYNDNPVVRIEVCYTVKEISDMHDIIENLEECYSKNAEENPKEESLEDKRIADALFEVKRVIGYYKATGRKTERLI